ncbi:putative ATP-dependent RNA helicase SrmB like protein [Actinobacillus pleuropneumoniae]|uniref:ATP-dependent RNA helicase SrmB n=1 Tax=Actinobacillus pleuropneumoniae TaxID=715 RepID=UPI000584B87A|nr:ATP-dependent RNA helicase SrmB [Actinobacillus pleuropneumoniae]KIE87834.1 putative ATP-dependent RNA helicase SrmB like protein [Actinobacillus pleuropneumoniae]KIE88030.1 putative ATP-dependent RNA helicase SrmB like protein [Actinobacillus pleuropneumoniae]KIE93841.1 putative ATP-dependent RNA helicase SrmB like protein [Actinobacillus pleuropneumoniae]KIE94092.1 putative ATP-dependent RNA helicase SrmB like protein [Actinobacillus pleuropneumoniae]KIE94786.1 putative ATP-dependent RNA 
MTTETPLMTFEELDLAPQLLKALNKKGYKRPTSVQAETVPHALDGRDLLGSAPTGTGKTAAFLLPAIQHLLDYPRRKPGAPRILILTPTRELAMQVAEEAQAFAEFTKLSIATITGGVAYQNHGEVFNSNQDIVVATPGRLMQYIKEENFDCRAVEILIFDEADRMLQMGFGQDAEKIAAETRWRKHTWLFSATLEGELLVDFTDRILDNPLKIDAEPSRRERKKIQQWYYHADNVEHKTKLLARLISTMEMEKAIVFVRRREDVRELSDTLRKRGLRSTYLEGDMAQTQRNQAITRLKEGVVNVLVATDVAARGIDIDDVDYVINFDLPYSADTYLHRIGRTARAGKKGSAISLVEAHDYKLLGKIKRYTEELLKPRVIEGLEPRTKAPKDGELNTTTKKEKARIKKRKEAKKEAAKAKVKVRHKDTKNVGKRRKLASEAAKSA